MESNSASNDFTGINICRKEGSNKYSAFIYLPIIGIAKIFSSDFNFFPNLNLST